MARSRPRIASAARRSAAALGALAAGTFGVDAGCTPLVSLDDRRCPCASGYHCCTAVDRCIVEGESCPPGASAGAGGDAGATVSGGASAATFGGGPGAAANAGNAGDAGADGAGVGSGGETGAGGDGEPRWRRVGGAELDALRLVTRPALELDAEGQPWIAFRACTACSSSLEATPPSVVRLASGAWQTLSTDGLAATRAAPGWSIIPEAETTGAFLLVERTVSAFDEAGPWRSALPELPADAASEPAFIATDGALHAAVFDPSGPALSVLRAEPGAWRAVGRAISAQAANARLAGGGGGLCLARITGDDRGAVVCFDGSGWQLAHEGAAQAVELAVNGAETLHVALQTGFTARIASGAPGALREIGMLPSVDVPRLALAADGTLYAAFLPDGYVNVSRYRGAAWEALPRATPRRGSSVPAIRVATFGARQVPYLAYVDGQQLVVEKYE